MITLRTIMKLSILTALLLLASLIPAAAQSSSALVTYPRPCGNGQCVEGSDYYSVRVRQGGGNWQNSFVYYSQGRHYKDDLGLANPVYDQTTSNSWTSFSFGGEPITVEVTKLIGGANSVIVRPQSDGVSASLSGNVTTFTIRQPGQFSVEFDGHHDHAMLIFADPLETYVPDTNDLPNNVHYFGPGIHEIGFSYGWWGRDGRRIREGDVIYIAGGAYLRGSIRAEEGNGRMLQDVHVIGRGVISGERTARRDDKDYDAFVAGRGSTIEGITISDPPHFGVGGLQSGVNWVKVMGWYGSTDAFAIRREAVIQNSFSKVNDDHIKAEPNQTVDNNVFWLQLNGSAVSLGYTYSDNRSGFTMTNSDVLHADSTERNAVIQATMGGGATIHNYHFEDIRIEGDATSVFGLAVRPNQWVDVPAYGNLRNMTFRNITVTGRLLESNWLYGFSRQHVVSNLRFDNLRINGRLITNGVEGGFAYGPYVENIYFLQNGNVLAVENSITSLPQTTGVYLPEADAWVREEHPDQNFGLASTAIPSWEYEHAGVVYTGTGRDQRMYLRFNVGSMPYHTSAYLVLMAKELVDGPSQHHVQVINQDSWGEGSITWNNARGHDVEAEVGTHTMQFGMNYINVTDALANHSNGRVTFRISGTEVWNVSRYYTREAYTPMLVFLRDEAPILPERQYPADGSTISNGGNWRSFEFERMDGIEWYGIWIGARDGSVTALYDWFPASDYGDRLGICGADTCTLPRDVWLPNGQHDIWMSYWGENYPHTDFYWNRTSFSIDLQAPNSFTLTSPTGSSLNQPPSELIWMRDNNALWYHIWFGRVSDPVHTTYYGWVDATEICNTTLCTLELDENEMPPGEYQMWVEMWGPGDYITWAEVNAGEAAGNFVISE
jgi:hypothetical protein